MSQYKESLLENGLRVITSTNANTPIATVSLWVRIGSRYESEKQSGYSHILEHLLCKKILDEYDNTGKNKIGAYINGYTGKESMCFITESLAIYAEDMINVLSNVIYGFDDNMIEFETKKKVILQEMRIAKENNSKLLAASAFSVFFGGNPLSKEVIGSEETIKNSELEELKKYSDDFLTPGRSSIIVASNLSHNNVLNLVKKYFKNWASSCASQKQKGEKQTAINPHKKYIHIKNSNEYTSILINFHTPGIINVKEETVLTMIASYLGGGHKSFLKERLRHKTGLVYTINVINLIYTDSGAFQISTSSSDPVETVKIIFDSLKSFFEEISVEDVEETKERSISVFDRFNVTQRNEIRFLGQSFILFQRMFKPEEYKKLIKEVTLEDVINVAKKYLTNDNLLLAVAGPKDIERYIDLT